MSGIAESHVEEAALAWLGELGYAEAGGPDIGPDAITPERASYGDVFLDDRLRAAIARLNPHLKAEARADVFRRLIGTETPSQVEENRRLHRYLIEGVPVEEARPDGSIGGETARIIDFNDPAANDWLAVNQFTVIENKCNRRPDVVVFVNGLPLGVIELKNPGDENATLDGAFNQLQTYKAQIGSLFRANALLVISDGMQARIGSLTADRERFMPWRTIDGDDLAPKGVPELEILLKGVFEKRRVLDLEGYHRLHRCRQWCCQDSRRLSPVPRGAPSGRAYACRHQSPGRPQGRGRLAYPGIGKEPAHGVLCRPGGEAPRHGKPDHRGSHRSQRP